MVSKLVVVVLVICLFLSFAVVFGVGEDWLDGWDYRISHVIDGSAGAGTNYPIEFTMHRLNGTSSGADVYLNESCEDDFSDIRFTADDGETLYDYWMEKPFFGESEIIDSLVFRSTVRLDSGRYLTIENGTDECFYSDDSGVTWEYLSTLPYVNTTNYRYGNIFLASNDYLYVGYDNKIYRSVDDGVTWTNQSSLGTESYTDSRIWDFVEDDSGNLYGGKYIIPQQTPAYIFNSTDNGATWDVCWNYSSSRHVHGLGYNPFNGYVYACFEGDAPVGNSGILRFDGSTWDVVYTGLQFTCVYTDGVDDIVYFGRDAYDDSIIYWSNDTGAGSISLNEYVDFSDYFVHDLGYVSAIECLDDDSLVVATVNNDAGAGKCGLFISTPERDEWFAIVTNEVSGFVGYEYLSEGLKLDEIIAGSTIGGGDSYRVLAYEYADFWVEVSDDLSSGSVTMYIYYGNSEAESLSSGEDVFLMYDGFEDVAINATTWTTNGDEVDVSTDYAFTGSQCFENGEDDDWLLLNSYPDTVNISCSVWYYDRFMGTTEDFILSFDDGVTFCILGVYDPEDTSYYQYRIGSTWYDSGIGRGIGWHELEIRVTASNLTFVVDGVSVGYTTTKVVSRSYLGSIWSANAEYGYSDDYHIRRLIAVEPSHGGYGEIEEVPTPTPTPTGSASPTSTPEYSDEDLDDVFYIAILSLVVALAGFFLVFTRRS